MVNVFEYAVAVGVGDGDGLFIDEDVAFFDCSDALHIDDVRAVGTKKALCGQAFFNGLHRQERKNGARRGGAIDFDVVLEPFDVENVVVLDSDNAIIALYEEALVVCGVDGVACVNRCERFEDAVGNLQKIGVGDGLEQVAKGVHLVAIDGILVESRSEYHLRRGGHEFCEFQSVELGHLNIEKCYVGLGRAQHSHGFDGIGVGTDEVEEGRLFDIVFEQCSGERFVVDDDAGECLHGGRDGWRRW